MISGKAENYLNEAAIFDGITTGDAAHSSEGAAETRQIEMLSGKAGYYLNESAILHEAGKCNAVHASEGPAQVRRVRKTGAVRGHGEGLSLDGELDGGHQPEPQDISPERNTDLPGEQMSQTTFGKTGMPRKVVNGHFLDKIFPLQQVHGCLDPRVDRCNVLFGITVKLRNQFFINVAGLFA